MEIRSLGTRAGKLGRRKCSTKDRVRNTASAIDGDDREHRLEYCSKNKSVSARQRTESPLSTPEQQVAELQRQLNSERLLRSNLERDQKSLRRALDKALFDMEALRAHAQHVQYLATHDALTNLPNGENFRHSLGQALSIARLKKNSVAVLYLDVDHFKQINDTYGHAIGDAVLRIVGARLSRILRAEDLVSRLAGDEFACLISGYQCRDQISKLTQKLIDSVGATERVHSHEISVCISVGIALFPFHGSDADGLLRSADAAMYFAKTHRLGRAFADELTVLSSTQGELSVSSSAAHS